MNEWPKAPTSWIEDRTIFVSAPFTWNLPGVRESLRQQSFEWDAAVVGGPAVKLLPDFFDGMPWVAVGQDLPGVLQRVHPQATRTTWGCPNRCSFCAVPRIEGKFRELGDWPDLPMLTDNNLLAASEAHFNRVIDRLRAHGWADFNQGLDARLLTDHHAARLAEIKKPIVRLALDGPHHQQWEDAFNRLRKAGIAKQNIRSYVLVAFNSDPADAWERCEFVESFGALALPQWFHGLDCMTANTVTESQQSLGWTEAERKHIMGYYYQHRGTVQGKEV